MDGLICVLEGRPVAGTSQGLRHADTVPAHRRVQRPTCGRHSVPCPVQAPEWHVPGRAPAASCRNVPNVLAWPPPAAPFARYGPSPPTRFPYSIPNSARKKKVVLVPHHTRGACVSHQHPLFTWESLSLFQFPSSSYPSLFRSFLLLDSWRQVRPRRLFFFCFERLFPFRPTGTPSKERPVASHSTHILVCFELFWPILPPRLGSSFAPHLPFSTRTGALSLSVRARHICFWERIPSQAILLTLRFFGKQSPPVWFGPSLQFDTATTTQTPSSLDPDASRIDPLELELARSHPRLIRRITRSTFVRRAT